jgi:phosphatidylglycerophosphate synthase
MKRARLYYLINAITMYRLVSAPFLLILAFTGKLQLFKWFVALSFLTDSIDGPLARKVRVKSVFGARLDSVADDATVLVATMALLIVKLEFVKEHWLSFTSIFFLFSVQTIAALVAYGKVTSFHTYLAKFAAVLQALFFMFMFFDVGPVGIAFYAAILITALQLLEEIILVIVLPDWKANVKGLYWMLRTRQNHSFSPPH